jgi:hypothetical protein
MFISSRIAKFVTKVVQVKYWALVKIGVIKPVGVAIQKGVRDQLNVMDVTRVIL